VTCLPKSEPPIGILLCTRETDDIVEFGLSDLSNQAVHCPFSSVLSIGVRFRLSASQKMLAFFCVSASGVFA